MQITLMRHGKPRLVASRWLAPCAMHGWIAQYDRSDVHIDAIPPEAHVAAGTATTVLTSNLPRARSSAAALGHPAAHSDALYREAALPHALWRFPPLPPMIWAGVFRVLWLWG